MAIVRKNYLEIGNHKWVTRKRKGNRTIPPDSVTFCSVCQREPDRKGIPNCIPRDIYHD